MATIINSFNRGLNRTHINHWIKSAKRIAIQICTSGASCDLSDGQEKIENHMLDFTKTQCFVIFLTRCFILTFS